MRTIEEVVDEISEYLDNSLHPLVSPNNWNVYSELHDMVTEIPEIHKAERPKGKWIMQHHIDKNRKGFNMWVCSECREEFSYDAETGVGITDANFCPNCGADMKQAESEEV